ncbi:unnamed protein product [Acanthosepion pharaonis]|uniref:Deleted in lung and esophageal cancer protein 1 Ig-like domain-containing protein n=1 Tax=Acanthosepion pharaonis TaxID=158019 RepID=A0A812AJU1_ACAPH|nr:unnamed protein product [Sepia pharaonis]
MAEFSSWEDTDREMKLKQIPSSVKSQDVSHILTTIFKDLLSKNSFNNEIIENQVNSKGSDDPYHERYVSELQKALKEKESRVAQIANLERYIIQAQARALSADEKHYNKYWSVGIYKDITTPNVNLQCHSVLDKKMLKENGLLIPDDYTIDKRIPAPPPEATRQVSQYSSKAAIKPTKVEQKLENQSLLTYSHSEKSNRNTEVKQIPKKKDLVFPVNNAWKEYPSLAERLKEKTIMAKMEAKANFLRNPRHQNLSLISGMTSLIHQKKNSTQADTSLQEDNDEESAVFIALPKEIVFNEYKTGNIYEATLELKNVSTVLRTCRVLPPASKYFTIGLGQFPGDHGLVAPGMSCIYTIRFAPDSLGDFFDELKIITQTSNSISVPLLGKRPHPVLTLPPAINLGYCLVGAVHMTQIVLKNDGGPGCFCLLPASNWPATNFRTVVREETVTIPPFVIRPSTFEMLSGQVGVLEIVFQPEEAKTFQEKVTIVCDNCQVKYIDIIGVAQKAEVMIVSSHDVLTEPSFEENPDKTEKHFIRFDNLNLFSYQEKRFMVKNCTNINLSFYWLKCTLTNDPTNQESFIYTKETMENPPFCIYPEYGNIPPAETLSFETVFAPEKVDCYKCVFYK